MCMSLISRCKSKEKGGHRRMGVMDSSSNNKDNDKDKDKRWSQTHTSAPRHRLQLPEFQATGRFDPVAFQRRGHNGFSAMSPSLFQDFQDFSAKFSFPRDQTTRVADSVLHRPTVFRTTNRCSRSGVEFCHRKGSCVFFFQHGFRGDGGTCGFWGWKRGQNRSLVFVRHYLFSTFKVGAFV